MSILEIPRIYFRGEISWDPVTTNNYPDNYEESKCETVFTKGEDVAAFRASAIDQVTTDGNWNPQGTYRSVFFDTCISGVDTGSGLKTKDPFVKAPVRFRGMLVDAEPYGATSSQLFFDDMSFGIAGGCRIFGKRVTRFHDRYINFARNPSNNMIAGVASVLWQTCFPKDQGLTIDPHNSPALKALAGQMDKKDVLGVMVRWDAYHTVYFDDATLSNGSPKTDAAGKKLRRRLEGGGFQPNPARSLVVGTVGLWRRGDPIHEPGDRAMISTGPQGKGAKIVMGTAFARTTAKSLTLDLSNCIPDASRAPEKVNLGTLSLTALGSKAGDKPIKIATIPFKKYNQAAYEASSGIVDISIPKKTAKALVSKTLRLTGPDGTIYLEEQALRAIPSHPNLYMNQGETVETAVQVYKRGKPAGPNIKVTLAQFYASQGISVVQKTDANGIARFALSGAQGAVNQYMLVPGDGKVPPAKQFDPQRQTYMTVRVLPADTDIAALAPTWKNVVDSVLGNWQAMAPCMDNWLDLGNKEQVRAYGPMIKKLTDPKNFEDFRFMPVSRDMTPGQRTLLYSFLDGKTATDRAAKKAVGEPDYLALSKTMRRPHGVAGSK